MTHATHTVHIDRPIEDVFDFLANGANNPRWQPLVVSTVPADDTEGAGSTFLVAFPAKAEFSPLSAVAPRKESISLRTRNPK